MRDVFGRHKEDAKMLRSFSRESIHFAPSSSEDRKVSPLSQRPSNKVSLGEEHWADPMDVSHLLDYFTSTIASSPATVSKELPPQNQVSPLVEKNMETATAMDAVIAGWTIEYDHTAVAAIEPSR
jgi:hypothetical protein